MPWFLPLIGLLVGLGLESAAGALLGALSGYALGLALDARRRLMLLESRLEWLLRAQSRQPQEARQRPAPGGREAAPEPTPEHMPEPAPMPEPPAAPPPESAEVPRPVLPARPPFVPPPVVRPSPPPDLGGWWERLLGGNLLAKAGVVVLFFGVASGLKLAVQYGLMPPPLRLALAVAAGLGLIWIGLSPASGGPLRPAWLNRVGDLTGRTRLGLGFALEGGGFAILYLAGYFALAWYGYLDPALAFVVFAGLGLACVALAIRQEGEPLALMGLAGAFLAPLLADTGVDRHLVLFGYVLLLVATALGASLYRAWRWLNLAALAGALILGQGWADTHYELALRPATELFVVSLFLLFTAAPAWAARRGQGLGWDGAPLLFVSPAAAAMAQAGLYPGDDGWLAMSSLCAGLWYALLWQYSRRSASDWIPKAFAALAIGFISLAPFIAFSRNTASVFWALEGAGLIGYAAWRPGRLPLVSGGLLQLLSGLLALELWLQGPMGEPLRNGLFHAGMLLAVAGLISAFVLRRTRPAGSLAFLAWGLGWWFADWALELRRLLSAEDLDATLLILATASFAVLEWLGRRRDWPDARRAGLLLLPMAALAVPRAQAAADHPLADGLLLALPAALLVLYWALFRDEADGEPVGWVPLRHVLLSSLIAWVLAWEAEWLAGRLPAPGLPGAAAFATVLGGLILLPIRPWGAIWPLGPHREIYLGAGLALPLVGAWLWLLLVAPGEDGAWALPYLPLLNPVEGAAGLLLWALSRHRRAAGQFQGVAFYPLLLPLAGLALLSSGLARAVHHYTGVAYQFQALWDSALFQALVSLAWTAGALLAMVHASRRGRRQIWFGGLGLLACVGVKLLVVDLASVSGLLRVLSLLGIGGLVLGAGYLAPVPPKSGPAPGNPMPG